jgi:hypothetical protein
VAIEDICGRQWDVVLRHGWYQLESHAGTTFRWAQSDAECVLFTFEAAHQRVSFDLEPGPGYGERPFTLIVFDAGGERKLVDEIAGRKTVSFTVTAAKPTVHVLRLHVPDPSRPATADPRNLDFRVFGIRLEREPEDVVAAASGCRVGDGWYPIERWDGTRFRWAHNDARIIVDDTAASTVELDVEPGPGMGGEPLHLNVRAPGGRDVGAYRLAGRERIAVPLPDACERPAEIVLHCEGGGNLTPGDARILNFRAFCGAP